MLSSGINHRRQRALQLLQVALQNNRRAFSDRALGTADFGYKEVPREQKVSLVGKVFSNVASSYDVMNDLMSGGMHRLWKDRFVATLGPFPGMQHLDVAGGTGDVAFRVLRAIRRSEAEERQRTGIRRGVALAPRAEMHVASSSSPSTSSYEQQQQSSPYSSSFAGKSAGHDDTRRTGEGPSPPSGQQQVVPPIDVELSLPGAHKVPTGGLSVGDFGSHSIPPPSHPPPEETSPESTQWGSDEGPMGAQLKEAQEQQRKEKREREEREGRKPQRAAGAPSSEAKDKAKGPKVDPMVGTVTVLDINAEMLEAGRAKAAQQSDLSSDLGLSFVEGNAESLPFPDGTFDSYTIAFGIRNVTDRDAALKEARRVLKHGGRFMCMEFSRVRQPLLRELYDAYSFNVIPRIGGLVANDAESYQYLVESIRRFPDQDTFAGMIRSAGLRAVGYENIMDGAVAMHWGYKL